MSMNPAPHASSQPSRLIVGGHSFIAELGNDPAIDFDAQCELVSACLDAGINAFDTTYQPERIALGRILKALNRRDEAWITAWNFFNVGEQHLMPPRGFVPGDIGALLDDLQTNRIDLVVVHPVKDDAENARSFDAARGWLAAGHVKALGVWEPGVAMERLADDASAFSFMFAPRNIANPNDALLSAGKRAGFRNCATSPFVRGWLLDKLIDVAAQDEPSQDRNALRAKLADAMLRFSFSSADVDHVVIGLRKRKWIAPNLASVARGPLIDGESQWLRDLMARTPAG
jgi:aryl-alcohol dehydrogenase-like predicted oxidoreductase